MSPSVPCPTCGTRINVDPSTENFSPSLAICQGAKPTEFWTDPETGETGPILHRTVGRAGYKLGCRCPDCTEGQRVHMNAYNARRRAREAA